MLNPLKVGARLEALSEGNVARLVTAQYERTDAAAGSAVREMVVFGAILEAVDRRIGGGQAEGKVVERIGDTLYKKNRNRFSAESLKGWLGKHCPTVHYETARAYYQAARAVREVVKLAEDVPLLALMGEEPVPEAKLEKKRQAVVKLLMSSSLNALRRLLRGGEAGRPAGEGAEAAGLDAVTSARMLWASPIGYFAKHRSAFYAAAALLTEDEARGAAEELEMALEALKKRLKEGKK